MTSNEHINGIVKQKTLNETKLLRKKNVVGVGVGNKVTGGVETDELCVRVYVEKKIPSNRIGTLCKGDQIPECLGRKNVKTDVIEIGKITAPMPLKKGGFWRRLKPFSVNRKTKHRPLFPGISIGNSSITAGTLGAICNWAGKKVLLSNAHVFCEDPFKGISEEKPAKGIGVLKDGITPLQHTEIIQQGSYDGGSERVGKLRKMVLIQAGKPNWVDCAMCELDEGIEVNPEIADTGAVPTGVIPWHPADTSLLGMEVIKSGRTTGVTRGKITDINATVAVNYGDKSATFNQQYLMTDMSAGGDSGSIVLRESDDMAVGLLFAGSETVTVVSPIEHVLKPLGISLVTKEGGNGGVKILHLDFRLEPEGNDLWTVKGKVVSKDTGTHLQATLILDNNETITASREGEFAFAGVELGEHTVLCEMEGYLSQEKPFEIN